MEAARLDRRLSTGMQQRAGIVVLTQFDPEIVALFEQA
jgi:hypothetical protein